MDQTTELAALRLRVAELEGELATAEARPVPVDRSGRWRATVSVALVVVGCLLAPFAVSAVWANRQVSDTDRYVATVTPLAHDPAVQAAVADRVSVAILQALDVPTLTTDVVDGLAAQGLPPRAVRGLRALQVPLNQGIEGFVNSSVSKVVASDQFATLWVEANRAAHASLVDLLSGKQGGAVTAQNGEVTLNLAPVIAQVKQRLVAQGYSAAKRIPPIDRSFVLVQSDSVTKAQGIYRLLDTLGFWLPIIALVLLAAGVYVAREHRRTLIGAALGVVLGMLALGVALAVGRIYYLDAVPSDVLPREAAASVFDTLVRFLRTGLRAVAVLGLVVAIAAFFTGPAPTAVRTRSALGRWIGSFRSGAEARGVQTGAFGRWTYAHRRILELALVGIAGFTLTFWQQPTGAIVIWTGVVVLVLVGLVELVSRPPGAQPTPAAAGPATTVDAVAAPEVPAVTPAASATNGDATVGAGHRP